MKHFSLNRGLRNDYPWLSSLEQYLKENDW